jgi:hypothetical protein
MILDIFEPYEIEIKTGRTKDEVIERFKARAYIYGDEFFIASEPYGFISRSKVVGEIRKTDDWTIVSFKIYASTFLKVFSYLWLGFAGLALVIFIIKAVMNWKYDSEIHWASVFWIIGFIMAQMTFRTSADMQEESIRQMIRSKE